MHWIGGMHVTDIANPTLIQRQSVNEVLLAVTIEQYYMSTKTLTIFHFGQYLNYPGGLKKFLMPLRMTATVVFGILIYKISLQ
jgi:hypothetical protein